MEATVEVREENVGQNEQELTSVVVRGPDFYGWGGGIEQAWFLALQHAPCHLIPSGIDVVEGTIINVDPQTREIIYDTSKPFREVPFEEWPEEIRALFTDAPLDDDGDDLHTVVSMIGEELIADMRRCWEHLSPKHRAIIEHFNKAFAQAEKMATWQPDNN